MNKCQLCNILNAMFIVSDDDIMEYHDLISDNELDSISNIDEFESDLKKAFSATRDIFESRSLEYEYEDEEEFEEENHIFYQKVWDKSREYLEKYIDENF